ncbi:Globin [Armadillidium nasatum]|uniref:Globin n=1 Tax=Armadillidium nasatum TaxID=96803 RepID=A0A5N5SQ75_9CRUS|nr:Globin [Armadillidium nasatum]
MGGVLSSLFGWLFGRESSKVLPVDLGPEADIPDPDTSLTPRQVAYVNTTWDLVRPEMKSHAVKFFILFFETHPEIQTRFKPFVGKKLEDLIDSKRLAAHATTVFSAIDSYISNLDDVSVVVEMLETTGINHKNRGINVSDFDLLPPVLIKYLGEALKDHWSEGAKQAWADLLNVVVTIIKKAYEKK